jgi:hypothetical protein
MAKKIITFALVAIMSMSLFSCVQPNVPIYTFSPNDVPATTSSPGPSSNPPLGAARPSEENVERNITVTDQNSVFSIGMPAGYLESTEINAEKPVDYWFEYLPAEAILEVDGKEIARDASKWETKLAYAKSVTRFSYRITNKSGGAISYNLHLSPSTPGAGIPVKIKQKWTPPAR